MTVPMCAKPPIRPSGSKASFLTCTTAQQPEPTVEPMLRATWLFWCSLRRIPFNVSIESRCVLRVAVTAIDRIRMGSSLRAAEEKNMLRHAKRKEPGNCQSSSEAGGLGGLCRLIADIEAADRPRAHRNAGADIAPSSRCVRPYQPQPRTAPRRSAFRSALESLPSRFAKGIIRCDRGRNPADATLSDVAGDGAGGRAAMPVARFGRFSSAS